ncbi:MAG: Lrp/AsnC ligand binding domain-containing protein [Candidatus Tectomicrobia bacterium]|nr:Lrp/AsnC ligand binding domain-containing protein [Candidatus Tectomicrobia bacterium]
MRVAYMLIKVEVGAVEGVASRLMEVEEVTEVYSISGAYDILAKVIVEDYDQFGEIIPQKIHSIAGIRATNTLLTFTAFK